MKNLRNALVLLLLAVFVVGCSQTPEESKSEDTTSKDTSSDSKQVESNPLQTIFENNPEVKKSYMGLPKEFQKKVFLPKLNTIPFVINSAAVYRAASGALPPGVKTNFDIILKSKNSLPRVHVITFDVDGQKPLFGKYTEKVKLKNNVEGYYTKTEDKKTISWLNSDETIQYYVEFKQGKKEESSISKEELVKMVNSMIAQIK